MAKLTVSLKIDPPPEQVDPLAFNALCDNELAEFEQYLERRQRGVGSVPSPLIGAERGILKAYLMFVHNRKS